MAEDEKILEFLSRYIMNNGKISFYHESDILRYRKKWILPCEGFYLVRYETREVNTWISIQLPESGESVDMAKSESGSIHFSTCWVALEQKIGYYFMETLFQHFYEKLKKEKFIRKIKT